MSDPRDSEGRKVFVGGIPFGVDMHNIREDFGRFGEIEDVYLPTDKMTGKLRGFGFVGRSVSVHGFPRAGPGVLHVSPWGGSSPPAAGEPTADEKR